MKSPSDLKVVNVNQTGEQGKSTNNIKVTQNK